MYKYKRWTDPSFRIRLANGLNRFAFRMFDRLCAELPRRNLVMSPSGLATLLAMSHLGAKGRTRDELAQVLEYSLDEDKRRRAFRELRESPIPGGIEFRSASRLWGQQSYHFLEEFLHETKEQFGAELCRLDFANNAEAARRAINSWVEEQTAHRIKDLLPAGQPSELARLVLTSAVYFLGSWEAPFEEKDTHEAPFSVSEGNAVIVPMMHQTEEFDYGASEHFAFVQLPYATSYESEAGGDFAMLVVLPNPEYDIGEVVRHLSESGMDGLPQAQRRKVITYVPRFRLENDFSLAAPLQALGVRDAFSVETADFSGMSDDPEGLFISDVVQKAFIEVNEAGTEAAAGTATMDYGSTVPRIPPPPVEFRADRPFLFLIRDSSTGLVHFVGRYLGPRG